MTTRQQLPSIEDGNPTSSLVCHQVISSVAIPTQNFSVGLNLLHANQQVNPTATRASVNSLLNASEQLLMHTRYQAAITTLGQQALATADLSCLFHTAATLVTETLLLDSCSIWRVLSDNLSLQRVASTGSSPEVIDASKASLQVQNWIRHLLEHDQSNFSSHQIRELQSGDCYLSEVRTALSGTSVRILGQANPLGLVIGYATNDCPINHDESQFLQSIAQVLAVAIERKRSEELLHTQTQVLEAVTSGVPLLEVFENLCLLLEQQNPGALCSVLLVDPATGTLQSGVSPSLPQPYAEGIEGLLIGESNGSCGTAVYRGEAVFVNDIASDPLWEKFRDFALTHNIRACWSTPFFSQAGEVLGTFALSHQVACEPSPYHLQILKTAAHLASLATERHRASQQLRQQALYDDLTGLPNRVFFLEKLSQKLQPESTHGHETLFQKPEEFAILFMDVDHFKLVNDSLGHSVGDQLLIAIVHLIKRCIRSTDTFARLGGDEFAILIEQVENTAPAQVVAERIRALLSFPLTLQEHEVFTSVSVGIAHSSNNYGHPEAMLRDADTAMYRAKALGRSRYMIFDQAMHTHALSRLHMESDLRHAVESLISNCTWQFQLYYQPIISLKTGKIVGFESLLRWFHSERGLVSPADFIPVAEETGLILPIGRWVLQESCSQLRSWQEKLNLPDLTISVNVSGRQFLQADFIPQIQQVLAFSKIPAHCLKLEITESVLMETAVSVTEQLEQLRDLGIHLSLDDFGTGYSSLSYLHRFPVNTLKIDRSFVQAFSQGQTQIVKAIVSLAHSLTMDVVAEGIETREQLTHLQQLRCQYGQGYLFSAPVSPELAEAMLIKPPWLPS